MSNSRSMSNAKLKRLQFAGWKTSGAKNFLQLSDEQAMLVELKLALTDAKIFTSARHNVKEPDTPA